MRFPRCLVSPAMTGIALLSLSLPGFAQFTFTTFDAPGSLSTYPGAINNNGEIAGTFLDANSGTLMGFILHVDGTFTTFSCVGYCRTITGINDLDEVVGMESGENIPFLRDSQGNISTFSGPPGTMVYNVAGLTNAGETIVQTYASVSPSFTSPAYFVRSSAGVFTSVPAPQVFQQGFNPYQGLNNNGEAVGSALASYANNTSGGTYGFLLSIASGEFTNFDYSTVPLPVLSSSASGIVHSTKATGLADNGAVTGCYTDGGDLSNQNGPDYGEYQCVSYVRSPSGASVTPFVPPLGAYTNTVIGINSAGEVVGNFFDDYSQRYHGYIGVPSATQASPVISLVNVIPGPPVQAIFSVVDPVGGIYDIAIIGSNCKVELSQYMPGQLTPVTVTATKVDQQASAVIGIQAWNQFGNVTDFDPALAAVYGTNGPKTPALTDVPPAENVLAISNGDPGLERLTIHVNDRALVVSLRRNEKRTINLKAFMRLTSNTLDFSGTGPSDAVAAVVVKDKGAAASN
jgi:hypothetical protein